MNKDMIDYHCHLLPALDDGAADLEESLEMARIIAGSGFSTVYCTPHLIKGCYENDPARVAGATRLLQARLEDEGIPLTLIPGCEHYLDEFLYGQLEGVATIGEGRAVLVEVPFRSGPELVRPMVAVFKQHGLTPLFAHPERCRAFEPAVKAQGLLGSIPLFGKRREYDLAASEVVALKNYGCRFQANLGSFAGYYGPEVRERALLFLQNGIYSCVGTDAHRVEKLQATIRAGIAEMVAAIGEESAYRLLRGFAV